jgi:hypothetical protein
MLKAELLSRDITLEILTAEQEGENLMTCNETLGWVNNYRVLYIFIPTPRQELVIWHGVFEHLALHWGIDYSRYTGGPYSSDAQEAFSRSCSWTSSRHDNTMTFKNLLSVIEKGKKRFSGQRTSRRKYSQRVQNDSIKEQIDLYIYVITYLGSLQAILLVEKMEIPIQGTEKARSQQQYVDFVRHVEFLQRSGFLVQVSSHVQLFLDRQFYLLQNLSEDRERYRFAYIQRFILPHLKPLLGKMMVESFLQAGVEVLWVTANEDYGKDRSLFDWLRVQKIAYILALNSNDSIGIEDQGLVWPTAASDVAAEIPMGAWSRLGRGEDSKGDQLYEWAIEPVLPYDRLKVVAGLEKQEGNNWLLVRRSLTGSVNLAYYLVFSPSYISLEEIVQVVGKRFPKGFFEKMTGLVIYGDTLQSC